MCGITGFLNTRSMRDAESTLLKMTNALTHRGPDDAGSWMNPEDGIGLGHRRLAIIDILPSGHQPMHSSDGRYVIVYNGEAYNFPLLKKELQAKGHEFSGGSDTEVILALIVDVGLEGALARMSGMFAFALWDQQTKVLHLARDRIGEKPLYYGWVQGDFVFGSELKALRLYPGFQHKINQTSVQLFMQYGYVPAPHSIYDRIYKLMPGTYLSISRSSSETQVSPKTYWSAIAVAQQGLRQPLQLSDDEAVIQLDHQLNAVVSRRMVSDVPIGAFLSGGIDSSLVVALMQAHSHSAVKTFTIGFHDASYNEAVYAKRVAQHLGTDHTELYVDPSQLLALVPRLPHFYDEPFADSSAIPTLLVSELARKAVTVCLSGDGGDETFGGYNRYLLASTLWKKITWFPYRVRWVIQKFLLSLSPSQWLMLLKMTRMPAVGDKLHKFASLITLNSPHLFYQYLISQWQHADKVVKTYTEAPLLLLLEQIDFIENMMLIDTLTYLPDDIMVKVDRASMAHSLETRAPYLDHDLIAWAWQLPLHMKIRKGESKWLLRQVLAKYVPVALFDRPKMGFGVPLDAWLRGPLRAWAEDLLDPHLIEKQGLLHAQPILEKWQEHLSGKRNWQYALWTVLMFQAWMGEI